MVTVLGQALIVQKDRAAESKNIISLSAPVSHRRHTKIRISNVV